MQKLRIMLTVNRWVIGFLLSHIAGYVLTSLLTVWIVSEVRKKANEIKRMLQK